MLKANRLDTSRSAYCALLDRRLSIKMLNLLQRLQKQENIKTNTLTYKYYMANSLTSHQIECFGGIGVVRWRKKGNENEK